MNWKRDGLAVWRPVKSLLFADKKAFHWIKDKLGLSEYQMAALAQKEIPNAEGHVQCPLVYVNTLGTNCIYPIDYEIAPTNGKACIKGWMNIGAGYCKEKNGPLGIL